MTNRTVKIATRKSPLAMWQAEFVRDALIALHPNLQVELVRMSTQGDKILDVPLAKVGGKGLFVKEIEMALLRGEIDLAVHSLKDMPTEQPEGLTLGAILERTDPPDALVARGGRGNLSTLPQRARVGTSSLRRRAQADSLPESFDLQHTLKMAGLSNIAVHHRRTASFRGGRIAQGFRSPNSRSIT